MEILNSTKSLEVGDKVIVFRYGSTGCSLRAIGNVIKKTPTGYVDVTYKDRRVTLTRFRPDGREYGAQRGDVYNYHTLRLVEYEEELGEEIMKADKLDDMISHIQLINWDKWNFEDVEKVYKVIREVETGVE